jgi:hypothetical protein
MFPKIGCKLKIIKHTSKLKSWYSLELQTLRSHRLCFTAPTTTAVKRRASYSNYKMHYYEKELYSLNIIRKIP